MGTGQSVSLEIFLRKQKAKGTAEASFRPKDRRRWSRPNNEFTEGESASVPYVKFDTNAKKDNGT
jgi:hypothetical protein